MPDQYYKIDTDSGVNVIELALPEMLDSVDFDRLNESMIAAVHARGAERWVIDLSKVSYMGSAMLGLMVNIRQQVRAAGGKLALCAMSPVLLRIFKTCCMERLFTIVKTRSEALAMK